MQHQTGTGTFVVTFSH